MLHVTLTYPTPDGSREIQIDGERTTFGRGSEAVHRFPDDGLSRLHATIYRDGDRVWIVDENSSNGTFVNGQRSAPAGTPLRNGDSVRIGHQTDLQVRISEIHPAAKPSVYQPAVHPAASTGPAQAASILPVALIACAILLVSLSAVFIGFTVFGGANDDPPVAENDEDSGDRDVEIVRDTKPIGGPKKPDPGPGATPGPDGLPIAGQPPGPVAPQPRDILKGRTYRDLSDAEKRQYLGDRAMTIARIIGNNSSGEIPTLALDKIKSFTEGYMSRLNAKRMDGCPSKNPWGDNLQATYQRARLNAPFINKAFQEKGVDPRIGLYLAMIESEHCVCLQSRSGPLGMFQFAHAAAMEHFSPNTGVVKGATDKNGDVRCEPEPAARAAASMMKMLTARFGTDPSSVPLAIGSYNSGQNGLSRNLEKALGSNSGLERDFWTLIANGEKLSEQFQSENFKYVPKFFAAAIIGENPQDFGLKLQPLSTYSK